MTEYEHQKHLVKWLNSKRLLFTSVPNENLMSAANRKMATIVSAKLKATGKSKGCPDLFIFLKSKIVAVELKREIVKGKSKPKPSTEQIEWIQKLNDLGHQAKVCYGWVEAKDFIESCLQEAA